MPLPFILGAAAIAAGAVGVKKGFDAKKDFNSANDYVRLTKELADNVNANLDSQKNRTNTSLEEYGEYKKNSIEYLNVFDSLIYYPDGERRDNQLLVGQKFAEKHPKIIITHEEEINILKELNIIESNIDIDAATEIVNIQKVEIQTITATLQAATGGTLAGLAAAGGAYAGVMKLGIASTGKAIAGLTGIAAKKATLAWLGGGSIATGGLGVTGGAAVLGGLVAGPLLGVGGAVMAAKAAAKKEEAYEAYKIVQAEEQKFKIIISKLGAIEKYTTECYSTLTEFIDNWKVPLLKLRSYARRNVTLKELSEEERNIVYANYAFYYTIYAFIQQPTMNKAGDNALEEKYRLAEKTNYFQNISI